MFWPLFPYRYSLLAVRFSRFASFLAASLAICRAYGALTIHYPLLSKRHAHVFQQGARLVVIAGRGHDGNVHAFHLLDLGVINLREDQLIAYAEGEIAASIEGLGRHPAE